MNKRFSTITCCFLYLWMINVPLMAQDTDDLFKARVYLPKGINGESLALQQAFKQVVVKVSGSRHVIEQITSEELVKLSRNFVNEFGLSDIPRVTESEFSEPYTQGLTAQYNKKSMLGWLKQKQLPIWPSKRVKIAILPVIKEAGATKFLSETQHENLIRLLSYAAEKRGIKIDIFTSADQLLIPIHQAYALDINGLENELVAFHDQVVISIFRVLIAEDGSTLGTSIYKKGDRVYIYSAEGENILQLFDVLLGEFIDEFSKSKTFFASLDTLNSVKVTIENVTSYERFLKMVDGIKKIEMVNDVSINRINSQFNGQSNVQLTIFYDSTENYLVEHINNIDYLTYVSTIFENSGLNENTFTLTVNQLSNRHIFKLML